MTQGRACPLENCRVALTGRFASLTHEELRGLVQDLGGRTDQVPMRHTKYLVVGEGQLPLDERAEPPRAIEKARQLQALGYPIEILPEQQFWSRCGLFGPDEPVKRLYTIGQLSRILAVKRDLIRRWLRAGLISPAEMVHRLALFDFGQVQSAKTLCDLAQGGVSTAKIREALEALRRWLPNLGMSLAQLSMLEGSGRLLVRCGEYGLAEPTGQLRFDFTEDGETRAIPWPDRDTAEELFDQALELYDSGRLEEAAAAYLHAIELDPSDPVLYFNLASVRFEQDRPDDAAAAYLEATQRDPEYVEAWNGLGCVLSGLKRPKEAIVAFRRAVQLVPDYGDAHFNLASELEQQGEVAAACEHWKRYLALDRIGPWADIARERLEAHEQPAHIC